MHTDTGVSLKDDKERVAHVLTAGRTELSLAVFYNIFTHLLFFHALLDVGKSYIKARILSS